MESKTRVFGLPNSCRKRKTTFLQPIILLVTGLQYYPYRFALPIYTNVLHHQLAIPVPIRHGYKAL